MYLQFRTSWSDDRSVAFNMIFSRQHLRALSLLFLFVFIALLKATGAEEIPLGAIVMQFRSTVDTDAAELNQRVENVTTSYLNQYFKAYYVRTEQGNKDYFEEVDLSTSSFGVHGVEGSFITTLEMEGTLSFNSDKVPSSFFIDALLRNAFEGQNEKLYLNQLLKEKEDEFLQNLTYVIIDINEAKVAESLLQDKSSTTNSTTNNNLKAPVGKKRFVFSEKWVKVMIYVATVSSVLMILACFCCLHQRCRRRKTPGKQKHKDRKDIKEPMKVIRLPVKKHGSSSPNDYDGENRRISPTSTRTTPTSDGSETDHIDMLPLSPQRSLPSQCSSMFTSDNMSKITKSNNDIVSKARSLSSPSKFSIDMPSIDLGAWRGGREDPPEFGSDISVIEKKKDLSLIAEEKCDIEAGLGRKSNNNNSRRNITSSSRYLSGKSKAAMHIRQSQRRSSHRSETYFYNGPHISNNDSDSDSDCPFDISTGGDVICDLKNLSMQIEQRRNDRR
eukprot:jgi/Psemu1/287659/fgenesh1_pg.207_\